MMTKNIYDVIIVGAGACGLNAAWELVQTGKKVALVEARDRVGGRILTMEDKNFDHPVELGAEFVHGNLALTLELLNKAAVPHLAVKGSIWQKKDGQLQKQHDFIEDFSDFEKKCKKLTGDIPVDQFIREHLKDEKYEELRLTLTHYVEGYYAADPRKASTLALCRELTQSDDVQYRIEGGYKQLVEYLYREAEQKGCFTYLSHIVKQVNWKENNIEVITNRETFFGKKILITVPLGVLQAEQISFSPSLDGKISAAKQLGFGPVIKITLQFDSPFWNDEKATHEKDLQHPGFIFSDEEIPTWWTQFPEHSAMLTGWLAGPHAKDLKELSKEKLKQKALGSLHGIFNMELPVLQQRLKGWQVANWATDPFNCGGYAYEVVNGSEHIKVLKEPLLNTIFFAGEGLFDGPEIGTVEAALVTGRETAYQIIASF